MYVKLCVGKHIILTVYCPDYCRRSCGIFINASIILSALMWKIFLNKCKLKQTWQDGEYLSTQDSSWSVWDGLFNRYVWSEQTASPFRCLALLTCDSGKSLKDGSTQRLCCYKTVKSNKRPKMWYYISGSFNETYQIFIYGKVWGSKGAILKC